MDRLAIITESNPEDSASNDPPADAVDSETGKKAHDITTTELNRLKVTLRPLVSDELQSRFVQALNKMRSNAPMSTSEMKLITVAFVAMADVIAEDAALTIRIRNTIQSYNLSATGNTTDDSPNLEFDDGEIEVKDDGPDEEQLDRTRAVTRAEKE